MRFAYFVLETQKDENGGYLALCAIEGESGYRTMGGSRGQAPWVWGKDFAIAEKCAKKQNAKLGLSEEDVDKIINSTMKAQEVRP